MVISSYASVGHSNGSTAYLISVVQLTLYPDCTRLGAQLWRPSWYGYVYCIHVCQLTIWTQRDAMDAGALRRGAIPRSCLLLLMVRNACPMTSHHDQCICQLVQAFRVWLKTRDLSICNNGMSIFIRSDIDILTTECYAGQWYVYHDHHTLGNACISYTHFSLKVLLEVSLRCAISMPDCTF